MFIVPSGGYRSLGLGGRAGLKQGGYGNQGAYGTHSNPRSILFHCFFLDVVSLVREINNSLLKMLNVMIHFPCDFRCQSGPRNGAGGWAHKRTGTGIGPGRKTW